MPFMEWSDKLSVGIKAVDEEHKKLVAMVNELSDAIGAGQGKETLGRILDRLITYTRTHFANEERLLAAHGYAQLAAHKAEHDALTKQVADVALKFMGGSSTALGMHVMSFLKEWLVKHILGTDKAYVPHLRAKGVS